MWGGQGPIKIESLSFPCQQVPKMNWPSRLLYHRKKQFLCTSLNELSMMFMYGSVLRL